MGFLRKAVQRKYETGANYGLGRSISSNGVFNIFGTGGDNINVLEEYNGFVWKAINIRAEELSAVDFFIERKVKDQWQDDMGHEFNSVMAGEEGGLDEAEFIEAHQTYMDMYGESFWYFSKGETSSKPFSRYLLDPAYVTVMAAGEKVTGYVYQREGDRIAFDVDEIAHYKLFNPANRFRGAGPMQKAGWFIRSSRYSTTFVNNFLENNAIPPGVVIAETADDKDWELFKDVWKSNYGGVNNLGKTGFLRGNNVRFEKTGLSLGDIDVEKITSTPKQNILEMFSIPKSKLGDFGDFNKASAVQSDETWAKTFTQKSVSRITRKMSRKVSKWYGKEFRYGSDFQVPEDRELKLSEHEKGTNKWLTVNEARASYGLPALGKEYDKLPDPTPPTEAPVKSLGKLTIKTVDKNTKAEFSYEMKESFRSETEDLQVEAENKAYSVANKTLEAQKKEVLSQLSPKKAYDTNFDVEKEARALEEAILPVLIELSNKQGALAIAFAGNESLSFELTPVARQALLESVRKATLSFTEETQEKLATILADGINSGASIASIAKDIDEMYSDVLGVKQPGYRLERLARTEVIKSSNMVTELAYKQSGVVSKKEWFNNPGACEFCRALNGSIITLGATFVSQGATIDGADGGTRANTYENINTPPAHPQCRCTLIPVIEG